MTTPSALSPHFAVVLPLAVVVAARSGAAPYAHIGSGWHGRLPIFASARASLFADQLCRSPFSIHLGTNDLQTLKPTLARLQAPDAAEPINGSDHAIFVFAGPERRGQRAPPPAEVERTLIGYDLTDGKQVFAVPADVRSRFPRFRRGVLCHREGKRQASVLRDAQTGAVRARATLEAGRPWLVFTCRREVRIYYVTPRQDRRREPQFPHRAGAFGTQTWRLPAQELDRCAGGISGTPGAAGHSYQDVVVLDARTRTELTSGRRTSRSALSALRH